MLRLSFSPALLCLTLACAAPKPEPAAPEPPAPKPAPEPNAAPRVKSDASDALRSVPSDATLVVRLRGDRLRAGPARGAITGLKQAIPEARQGLTIAQAACGFDPVEAIQELVFAARHQHISHTRDPLGRVQIDPRSVNAAILLDRPAQEALNCLENFLPVTKTEVGAYKALVLPTGGVLLAHHELLMYTPEGQAEAATQRIDTGAPLNPGVQATLDANPESLLVAYGAGNNALGLTWASLAVAQPDGGISVKGLGLAESPEAALAVKQKVSEQLGIAKTFMLSQPATSDAPQRVSQLLDKVEVTSNGSSLSLRLALDKAEAEAFFSDVVVALVQDGVVAYTLGAKTAEARDNVMRIALALGDYARANSNAKRRFPQSAPLSPSSVPGRVPVKPSGFDHPSWQAIHFAPSEPVLYAYEFVTAADGRSVEVIARGDLDGDGQTSKYAVKLTIEGQEPKIAPDLTREQPYE